MKRSLKHLSFSSLRHRLGAIVKNFSDNRQPNRISHTMHDIVMSGFAMMYFQDPSLLHFQQRLRKDQDQDNLQTLFGVETIPKETQMRDVLDELDREQFRPVFEVNLFSYRLIDTKNGERKVTLKYSWVTDFEVTKNNVESLVRYGRCRWKIENECFNTLKNQGYALEHNYGHGKKSLSFNFLILTLLAFFTHQIAELTDNLFQSCRKKVGSKKELWSNIRAYIKIFVFESMEMLFAFVLKPDDFLPVLSRPG